MGKNMCGADRLMRVVAGLALIGATLAGQIGVWGWIGVVPLLTGIVGFCPAYLLFGKKSCPINKK